MLFCRPYEKQIFIINNRFDLWSICYKDCVFFGFQKKISIIFVNMPDSLLIKNTSLYYNIQDTIGYDILMANGKITCVAPSGDISPEGAWIDGTGFIAVPGLIDIHIHGAGGADSLDGTKKALETISRTLASLGTTSFLSTMVVKPGTRNTHLQIAGECTGTDLGGAILLGVYVEGPFINEKKRGGILPESITEPSTVILEEILDEAGNALKMMCVAPEILGIDKIIVHLREKGIKVALGHSDADYEETKKGFAMGINHVTHLFNAMRQLHHRDPGPLAAIFEDPGISIELIGDSHHVHPALVRMVWNLKGPRNIASITDGISATGLPDGTYTYNNKKYTSKEGLARYLDGTLIGSTMSLARVAGNFKAFTGCSFREAIDTVTINPANIIGIGNRKGSLDAGKDADIVLMDSSFNVRQTIIAGKSVYQSKN
jgi:N-acetylglucosamine-6-phosphate deacetylase